MNTKNNFIVLGDSFCTRSSLSTTMDESITYFWVDELFKHFKDGYNLVLDSMPSRDMQTIIDNWIKLIKHIKEDDILIVCVPNFTRIRVPIHPKDYFVRNYNGFDIINRYVTHHSWYIGENEKIYAGDEIIEKKELDKHITFLEHIYFNHTGVENNYNEVIKSLYYLTNCKKYFFSWDDMSRQISEIEYKSQLTEKLGWSTLHDLYLDSNGTAGRKGDFHWDYRFQEKFVPYLLEKFKK